jgi:hypothetical protein
VTETWKVEGILEALVMNAAIPAAMEKGCLITFSLQRVASMRSSSAPGEQVKAQAR